MACLYLCEDDVASLVDMPTAIEAVRGAFAALAASEAENVPRQRARAVGIVLHSMSAAAGYLGLVGWKQYTTTREVARFHVGLYEAQSGEMVALIAADRLGQLRTGAVTGLAASLLALPGVRQMGLFGAGWQAESQLAAVAAALPIERVVVYSRNEEKRAAFCERMSKTLNIDVAPASQPDEAVDGMPIVVTATTSREPVFDGERIAPGALVCAAGSNWLNKAEIDVAAVKRANLVVCDSVAACRIEAGDFSAALAEQVFDWPQAIELADIVAGKHPGRENAGDVVLFKSVGMALEDVALGAEVLKRAKEKGVGVELDL